MALTRVEGFVNVGTLPRKERYFHDSKKRARSQHGPATAKRESVPSYLGDAGLDPPGRPGPRGPGDGGRGAEPAGAAARQHRPQAPRDADGGRICPAGSRDGTVQLDREDSSVGSGLPRLEGPATGESMPSRARRESHGRNGESCRAGEGRGLLSG